MNGTRKAARVDWKRNGTVEVSYVLTAAGQFNLRVHLLPDPKFHAGGAAAAAGPMAGRATRSFAAVCKPGKVRGSEGLGCAKVRVLSPTRRVRSEQRDGI